MAKPSSSATLNTGHALYTNLTAVWALLEGSGTTSADKKGSRTLTLSGSGLWSTDGDGPVILTTSNADSAPLALASSIALDGSHNFSIAWRAKQTTSNDNGMLLGEPANGNNYIWMRGGTGITFKIAGTVVGTFSGITDFTALDDYVFTAELEPAVTYHYHLYKNGTEVSGSPVDNAGVGLAMTITHLLNGHTSSLAFVGTLSYLYFWTDRILTSTEAGTIDSDPYAIFTGAGGGAKPAAYYYNRIKVRV
jgi:hypothetical protein